MQNEDIIRKIKKIMAIAEDTSASDQEIQLAAFRARKLMIQYKIDETDLLEKQKNEEVIAQKIQQTGNGYMIWVLNVIAKSFRCQAAFIGKFNKNDCMFKLYGLKQDVDLCLPVANGIVYYLNSILEDLKECYIGTEDFRVYKRNYLSGFASGLEKSMEKALLEMNLNEKYELAIIDVPSVVKEYCTKKLRNRKSHFTVQSRNGYSLGYKHGSEYDVGSKDLIENNERR